MSSALYTNFIFGPTGERRQMLVEDGRVASRSPIQVRHADTTVDCQGRYLYPAFVDNHCHILPTGLDLGRLNLDACSTKQEVLDSVRDALLKVDPGQWLRAVHYDQTKFPDGTHLSMSELDKISDRVPILLRHVNGHAGVANSAALEKAGITQDAEDPKGGSFVRDQSGRLTGVLLEKAHEMVSAAAPRPDLDRMVEAIILAGQRMKEFGIGTAADLMTGQFDLDLELQAYKMAAERGCPVRLRLYLQWSAVFGPRALIASRLEELARDMRPETCRIAGVKLFADGAIGSATAAIHGEFSGGGNGQLIYAPDRLKKMVRTAHDAGYQIAVHSIGDRSTDLVLDAYADLDQPQRHRIEHAMILSDYQIERMARLGISCTMQPEFLMRFRHSYLRQLGPDRASKLKRWKSVMNAGIPLSFSSDRPIVQGDPLDGIATAVRRPDPYDQSEIVSVEQAFEAYTGQAARALGDQDLGRLDSGCPADFRLSEQSLQEEIKCRFSPETI